jgi:hypothetical protein
MPQVYMPRLVIPKTPAFRRQRWEDEESQASLGLRQTLSKKEND